MPLHHIRDLLGRADNSTTSRYLAVTPTELQRSMQMAEERQRGRRSSDRAAASKPRKSAGRIRKAFRCRAGRPSTVRTWLFDVMNLVNLLIESESEKAA